MRSGRLKTDYKPKDTRPANLSETAKRGTMACYSRIKADPAAAFGRPLFLSD